jgi:hypothetical protein
MLNKFFKVILNCFKILAFFKQRRNIIKYQFVWHWVFNESFSNRLKFWENNNSHDFIMNFCIYYELDLKSTALLTSKNFSFYYYLFFKIIEYIFSSNYFGNFLCKNLTFIFDSSFHWIKKNIFYNNKWIKNEKIHMQECNITFISK